MGLFSPKVVCSVCGKECGLNRYQIENKEWCCSECFSKAGFKAMTSITIMNAETIRATIQKREQDKTSLQSFRITREVARWLKIDENRKEWYIPDGFAGKAKNPRIHRFDEILGYELLEDGDSITKGGLGRAVAGGLLFGGVGAVVGGVTGKKKTKNTCTSLRVKITLNDITMSTEYINLIASETKKNGILYKTCEAQAQEIVSILQVICESCKAPQGIEYKVEPTLSAADEIMKFKQLLDAGVITQEEFEAQKKQLLGL